MTWGSQKGYQGAMSHIWINRGAFFVDSRIYMLRKAPSGWRGKIADFPT
jgi:hypothetical protein